MSGKKIIAIVLLLTVAAVFISFFVPAPETILSIPADQFRAALAVSIFEACLYIGAAILFISGLASFTKRLRRVYIAICAGLVVIGLSALQIPFLIGMDIFEGPWVRNGGISAFNGLAAITFYAGLYLFAKTLRRKQDWTLPAIVTPLIALAALASIFIHTKATAIGFAIEVAGILFAAVSTVLAFRIRRHIGTAYIRATGWLSVSLLLYGCAFVVAAMYDVLFLQANPGLGMLYTVDSIFFLIAGYKFKRISEGNAARQSAASAIEVVSYLASLVSDTASIDPALDPMRAITASITPGQKLNDEQQRSLAKVYQALEAHLLTHDPLRNFTQQTLRADIDKQFPVRHHSEDIFWQAAQQ